MNNDNKNQKDLMYNEKETVALGANESKGQKREQRHKMNITYEVCGALYVNLTNRCNNSCIFCIRKNGDGAYGSDSLWLEREPTDSEALAAVLERDLFSYSELVFCGYGEPSFRLDACRLIANEVHRIRPDMTVRINTNGTSDIIHGTDTAPLFSCFDTVSISLNAPTAAKYDEISHPVSNLSHFPSIIAFAKNVKNYVHNTVFTVVGDFLTKEELEAAAELCRELGIPLRVREYVSE